MPDHVAAGARPRRGGLRRWPRAHVDAKSVLFLGRHAGYPVALEGALKLKELAYIHAEGFAAGELKHGPIALIEDRAAGASASCRPRAATSCTTRWSAASRRSGPAAPARSCWPRRATSAVAPYADVLIRLPKVPTLLQPMVAVVPLQLFACELATLMGHDVDQPRNLAKSVTVE